MQVIVAGALGVGTGFVLAIAVVLLVYRRIWRTHAVQFVTGFLRGLQSTGNAGVWVAVRQRVVPNAVRSFASTERGPMTVVLFEDLAAAIETRDFSPIVEQLRDEHPEHPSPTPHPI